MQLQDKYNNNARQVFLVNLSSLFFCLQINKLKGDDTQYIKLIDN